MEGNFYIGNRKRKKRKSRGRFPRILLFLLVLLLFAALGVHLILYPQAKAICELAISNRLEALANERAYDFLSKGGYTYDEFIHLIYTADGTVCAATVDTVRLNLLKTSLATSVLASLRTSQTSAEVSVGSLTGLLLLSERGKSVKISAKVNEGMRARFHTVFTSAGINQTRHAIGFSFEFTAVYFLASHTEKVTLSIQVPIGETILVGAVPDSLTQISRLTDDVTEIEIDDAVDFGNVLP